MRTNGCMGGFLSWSPLQGVRKRICVPKVFVSVFFLGPMTCVTRGIRLSIRKRSTRLWNLPQVEWSKLQWNISIGGHLGTKLDPLQIQAKNLKESIFVQFKVKLADFRRVAIFWIPGTHIQLTINNFTETLCNVDDWLFYFLSLCLFPCFVYYLCRFVTVCTVKRFGWGVMSRSYFTSCPLKTLILDRLEHAKKWPENLSNTFYDALAILNFF